MTKLPENHHAEAITRAEALIDLILQNVQTVLNGLADRPKPGTKKQARGAIKEILEANRELWRFIELKKPVQLVASDTPVCNRCRIMNRMDGFLVCEDCWNELGRQERPLMPWEIY